MTNDILILTTMPDDDRADDLARALVGERLAACVTISGPMVSTYRWEGDVQRETERQLTIKTTRTRLADVERRLHELHPYELPEFLVLDAAGGSEKYLQWIGDSTK
jgi:periplasmic divalent cation tolerance protein